MKKRIIGMSKRIIRTNQMDCNVEEIIQGILQGERRYLSRAITLIESSAPRHQETARAIIEELLPYSGKSIRVGMTGVPGVGKSTFIETFGRLICDEGKRMAVLAVDPSSTIHGGSILADKTRMEQLAKHPNAFIRPSPSEGILGGVHRKTRESIIVCEAAGYEVIMIETVGVGQSEAIVREMVDFFMLLVLSEAGDDLQAMKKGIMEMADVIIINKADGNHLQRARKTRHEYQQVLYNMQPATLGWKTKSLLCSSISGDDLSAIWELIKEFRKVTESSGVFEERRKLQMKAWLVATMKERLEKMFFQHEAVKSLQPNIESQVMNGEVSVSYAVDELFFAFLQKKGQR